MAPIPSYRTSVVDWHYPRWPVVQKLLRRFVVFCWNLAAIHMGQKMGWIHFGTTTQMCWSSSTTVGWNEKIGTPAYFGGYCLDLWSFLIGQMGDVCKSISSFRSFCLNTPVMSLLLLCILLNKHTYICTSSCKKKCWLAISPISNHSHS